MTSEVKAILFDLNETLIHQTRSEVSHVASTYSASAPLDGRISFEAFAAAWKTVHGRYTERFRQGCQLVWDHKLPEAKTYLSEPQYKETIAAILAELRYPASEQLIKNLTSAFQTSRIQGRIMPAANLDVLQYLASKYRLGIITNFQQPELVPEILSSFGIDKMFDPVIVSATVGYRKPHPEIFHAALEQLDLIDTPERGIYVGDNPLEDARGAALFGLRPILLDRNSRYAFTSHPYLRIQSLSQLPNAIEIYESMAGNERRQQSKALRDCK